MLFFPPPDPRSQSNGQGGAKYQDQQYNAGDIKGKEKGGKKSQDSTGGIKLSAQTMRFPPDIITAQRPGSLDAHIKVALDLR